MTRRIIIPTVESVEAFGLNRYPKGYSTTSNNNPFVRLSGGVDRNQENSGLNEVELLFYKFTPRYREPQQSGENTTVNTRVSDPIEIAKFDILLDQKDTEFEHVHTWSKPEASSIGLLNKFQNAVTGITQNFTNVVDEIRNIVTDGDKPTQMLKEDTMHKYESTSPIGLDINFTLMTKDNFLRDIYEPLMLLSSLTYPTRVRQLNQDWLSDLSGDLQIAAREITNLPRVNSRVHFVDSPCLVDARHKSNLYNWSGLYVEYMKYEFKGPWYNGYFAGNNDMLSKELQYLKGSYPTHANVHMKLKHGRMIFADDILSQLKFFTKNNIDDMNINVNETTPDNLLPADAERRGNQNIASINKTNNRNLIFDRTEVNYTGRPR